jgi:hypothetical protein
MAREMQEEFERIILGKAFNVEIANAVKAGIEDATVKTSDLLGRLQNLFTDANPEKVTQLTSLFGIRPDPTTDKAEFDRFNELGLKGYEKVKGREVDAASAAETDAESEGIKADSSDVNKSRDNYANTAKEFLNKLKANKAVFDVVRQRNQDAVEILEDLEKGQQPLVSNDEVVGAMQILARAHKSEQEKAGVAEPERLADQAALEEEMKKAQTEQKNIADATKAQNQQQSGQSNNLEFVKAGGKGLIGPFDIMVDKQAGLVQAQRSVFKRTSFDAVLKVAAGEQGVIGQFKNVGLLPPLNPDMLGRKLSATKNKYVKRRLESIHAALKNDLNPRSDIAAIFPHIKWQSQRDALQKAMNSYNESHERFKVDPVKYNQEKPGYQAQVKPDNTAKAKNKIDLTITEAAKTAAAKPAPDAKKGPTPDPAAATTGLRK